MTLAKKSIAVAAALSLIGVAYYGTYLPYKKSAAFITALRGLGGVTSIQGMEKLFSGTLEIPSPIGQEELVRNVTSNLFGSLQQASDPNVAAALTNYIRSIYDPILARGKGMSFGQNLYLLGAVHEIAYVKTNDPKYLDLSFQYFEKGYDAAPRRPQFLFGLFDVYRFRGDAAGVETISKQIVEQWPGVVQQEGGAEEQHP